MARQKIQSLSAVEETVDQIYRELGSRVNWLWVLCACANHSPAVSVHPAAPVWDSLQR